MRYAHWLLRVCPVLIAAGSVLAAADSRIAPWIPASDIDEWSVEMYCGNPSGGPFAQGPKNATSLSGIVVFDSQGNGYIAQTHCVVVVTRDGQARILTGQPGLAGDSDGPPGKATFGQIYDIALVNDNLLYVADSGGMTLRRIARVDGVWQTTTVAGVAGVMGHRDGPAGTSIIGQVFDSIVADEKGAVYLFDGDWIRKYADGVLTTLNPDGGTGYVNGPLRAAKFAHSQGSAHGLTYDGHGCLYVADKVNMCIRKIDLGKGDVSTFAGVLPGVEKVMTRDGPATEARFHPGGGPNIIYYNARHNIFLCHSDDESRMRIIREEKDGWVMHSFATPGQRGKLTGPLADCVGGIVCGVDAEGHVYVRGSGCIRVVKKTGANKGAGK